MVIEGRCLSVQIEEQWGPELVCSLSVLLKLCMPHVLRLELRKLSWLSITRLYFTTKIISFALTIRTAMRGESFAPSVSIHL